MSILNKTLLLDNFRTLLDASTGFAYMLEYKKHDDLRCMVKLYARIHELQRIANYFSEYVVIKVHDIHSSRLQRLVQSSIHTIIIHRNAIVFACNRSLHKVYTWSFGVARRCYVHTRLD